MYVNFPESLSFQQRKQGDTKERGRFAYIAYFLLIFFAFHAPSLLFSSSPSLLFLFNSLLTSHFPFLSTSRSSFHFSLCMVVFLSCYLFLFFLIHFLLPLSFLPSIYPFSSSIFYSSSYPSPPFPILLREGISYYGETLKCLSLEIISSRISSSCSTS